MSDSRLIQPNKKKSLPFKLPMTAKKSLA